jgi:hypothetical protein
MFCAVGVGLGQGLFAARLLGVKSVGSGGLALYFIRLIAIANPENTFFN